MIQKEPCKQWKRHQNLKRTAFDPMPPVGIERREKRDRRNEQSARGVSSARMSTETMTQNMLTCS